MKLEEGQRPNGPPPEDPRVTYGQKCNDINICPKCGWEDGNYVKHYVKGETGKDEPEHLWCSCERCKYGWRAEPLTIDPEASDG